MDERNPASGGASGTSRLGVVDIGTNSTKLEVVDIDSAGGWSGVAFERRIDRIGEGMAERRLVSEAALRRLIATLGAFRLACDRRGCDRVVAFATEAFRAAKNRDRAARRIERETGVAVRVLTGKDEALLAYRSARYRFPDAGPRLLLIDVGGGSTEFVAADDRDVAAVSEPLGALALSERFCREDPVSPRAYAALVAHVRDRVARVSTRLGNVSGRMIASGGAAATLLAMTAAPGVQTARLGDLRRIERLCAASTVEVRRRLRGLEHGRADIILAGAVVVTSVMRAFHRRVLLVNPGGVREGVVVHLIENAFQWPV